MSERERVWELMDLIPDHRIGEVVTYLENYIRELGDDIAAPNEETLAAIAEVEEMKRNGTGQKFEGSAEDLFKMLLEEDDEQERKNR